MPLLRTDEGAVWVGVGIGLLPTFSHTKHAEMIIKVSNQKNVFPCNRILPTFQAKRVYALNIAQRLTR